MYAKTTKRRTVGATYVGFGSIALILSCPRYVRLAHNFRHRGSRLMVARRP